jgi:hypothetical protein
MKICLPLLDGMGWMFAIETWSTLHAGGGDALDEQLLSGDKEDEDRRERKNRHGKHLTKG